MCRGACSECSVIGTCFSYGIEKLRGRHAPEILDHPVVGKDLHLVVRERNRQHPVVFAGASTLERATRAGGARRTVVSVGDIQVRDLRKRGNDVVVGVLLDRPQHVSHAIAGREIKQRRAAGHPFDHAINGGSGQVGQEHGTRLRADSQHVPGAVVFLVGSGFLVFLDQAPVVLVDGKARGNARLCVIPHV